MADDNQTADEVELPEVDGRAERELVEFFDTLSELKEENRIDSHVWDIEITSPEGVLTEEQCEAVESAVRYTIGSFRGIVGNDKYIPRAVYWDLVEEYAEEVIEALQDDPDWADSDLDVFREIVMPTEMSRHYHADPVANFSVLYNSRHTAAGWVEEMKGGYYGTDFEAYVEDEGWKEVLSEMAYVACLKDVAQQVRREGHDLDLGHIEYK